MTRRIFLITGGFVAATVSAFGSADQIFRTGPEILIADSSTILVGVVSSYSKTIETVSQPGGDGMPLTWVITGRLEQPKALKGIASGPISFSRKEYAFGIPTPVPQPDWELEYGRLSRDGRAVVFLIGDSAEPTTTVLPSGAEERDLAALVKDVVAIQAIRDKRLQLSAWLTYIERTHLDEGRKAGLRSALREHADWLQISPLLERLMADPSLTDQMRAYAFGFVSFGLTEHYWDGSALAVVDLLARRFESEKSPTLALQYIVILKLVLRYTMEEATRTARAPLRERIVDSLRRTQSSAATRPEIAEQYRQILATYPGLW